MNTFQLYMIQPDDDTFSIKLAIFIILEHNRFWII